MAAGRRVCSASHSDRRQAATRDEGVQQGCGCPRWCFRRSCRSCSMYEPTTRYAALHGPRQRHVDQPQRSRRRVRDRICCLDGHAPVVADLVIAAQVHAPARPPSGPGSWYSRPSSRAGRPPPACPSQRNGQNTTGYSRPFGRGGWSRSEPGCGQTPDAPARRRRCCPACALRLQPAQQCNSGGAVQPRARPGTEHSEPGEAGWSAASRRRRRASRRSLTPSRTASGCEASRPTHTLQPQRSR